MVRGEARCHGEDSHGRTVVLCCAALCVFLPFLFPILSLFIPYLHPNVAQSRVTHPSIHPSCLIPSYSFPYSRVWRRWHSPTHQFSTAPASPSLPLSLPLRSHLRLTGWWRPRSLPMPHPVRASLHPRIFPGWCFSVIFCRPPARPFRRSVRAIYPLRGRWRWHHAVWNAM